MSKDCFLISQAGSGWKSSLQEVGRLESNPSVNQDVESWGCRTGLPGNQHVSTNTNILTTKQPIRFHPLWECSCWAQSTRSFGCLGCQLGEKDLYMLHALAFVPLLP